MCARFVLKRPKQDLETLFDLKLALDLPPRCNIAPSQPILAIRHEATGRKGALLTWGLVPHWAKDPSIGSRLINARAETIATKPAFRDAFRYRRCLIPADGFYEWKQTGKIKQPYFIHRADGGVLALAGLWEHWQDAHGTEVESCTIITTRPNAVVAPLHDRMPVILESNQWADWLSPQTPAEAILNMLSPSAESLAAYPVNKSVNNPKHDDAGMLERAESLGNAQNGLFGEIIK